MELRANRSKDTFIISKDRFIYPKDFELHLLETYLANDPSMKMEYYGIVTALQELLEDNDVPYFLKFYVSNDGSEHKFNFDPNELNSILEHLIHSPHEGYF